MCFLTWGPPTRARAVGLGPESSQQIQSRRNSPELSHFPTWEGAGQALAPLDSPHRFCLCGSVCHKSSLCTPRVRPTGTKQLENSFLGKTNSSLSLHPSLPSLGVQRRLPSPRPRWFGHKCSVPSVARPEPKLSVFSNRCAEFKREESARGSSIPRINTPRRERWEPTPPAAQPGQRETVVHKKRRNVHCKNLLLTRKVPRLSRVFAVIYCLPCSGWARSYLGGSCAKRVPCPVKDRLGTHQSTGHCCSRGVLLWSWDAFLAAFGGCALRKRGKKEPSGAFPALFSPREKAKLTCWWLGRT